MEPEDTYTGPERRESPRDRVSLRARWGGGEWAGREGTVTNLSADGCFVTTEGAVAVPRTPAGRGQRRPVASRYAPSFVARVLTFGLRSIV